MVNGKWTAHIALSSTSTIPQGALQWPFIHYLNKIIADPITARLDTEYLLQLFLFYDDYNYY